MTKCTGTLALGVALAFSAAAIGCGSDRNNGGAITKPKDAAVDDDAGVASNDTGVPPGGDSGVPPGSDSGVPPGNDSGVPPNDDAGTQPNNDGGMQTGFDGGMLTGDPFNANTLAAEYAGALCAFRTRCEPALHAFLGETEAQCRTEITNQLLTFWPAYNSAITANRAAFRRTGFDACLQAYANADCVVGVAPNACDGMFAGNRPVGAACGTAIECSAGSWCALEALGGCGVCTDRAGAGENCSATLCETTMDCFNVNNVPTCAPINAQENGTCGDVQSGLCQGRLQCVGTQAGVCQRPAGPGQACESDGTGAAVTCNIYQSQTCVAPANTCQSVTFVGVGSMCSQTVQCNVDTLACDPGTNTCSALPGVGTACPDDLCVDGAYCNAAASCAAEIPSGMACTDAAPGECGDLFCVSGSCGVLTWQACN